MIPDVNRALVCIHEASHAVVAMSLGETVDRVTIAPDGGQACFHPGQSLPLLDNLVVLLAGGVAHENFAALHGLPTPPRPVDDLDAVREHLHRLGDDRAEVWGELVRITTAVVASHWPTIGRVAMQLDRAGEITGAEISRVRRSEITRQEIRA